MRQLALMIERLAQVAVIHSDAACRAPVKVFSFIHIHRLTRARIDPLVDLFAPRNCRPLV
jgi:hypothetical protein